MQILHSNHDKTVNDDGIRRYADKDHCIYHGDAIKVLNTHIQDESIDLIFVDPPYNIDKEFERGQWNEDNEYIDWVKSWLDILLRKLKPHGALYFMAATQYMPHFDIFLSQHMNILSRIIWYYDSSGAQAKYFFGSRYEPILFCVKDKKHYVFNAEEIMVEAKTGSQRKLIDYRKKPPQPYNSSKVPGNVWEFPRVRYRMPEYEQHPSQKPEKLLERIILTSSNKGDIILDPFSGTFTTSKVARDLKRRSIGIESNIEYVKIGLKRLSLA
ncbi:MAG: adenine-specific DNA-methyltransferase [Candidatus Heimdallarchaeota archaeon]|nr:adenine-specific DNA-methyltransferase [Candidatus Heimdallarchaeota archaeon]